ncbi:ornithine--oxo-acid transaminase [Membranihabitans marinus]|uniref:ornithine--oxo-acid transaminase n=1 Tax=Membranihabitans marinus TaxID=1227546 RepID=UPI001F012F64|nr:ornithine--oxo-acid transaminase [Membranihabitans marinus]
MKNSKYYIDLENQFSAHNYHPLPVVLSRGEDIFVYDVEGKKYYDFLAAYSAVNQGHNHPALVQQLIDQVSQLSLVSRAFHSDQLAVFAQYICQLMNYDKVLPMNTGAEAVETAIKLCRKWAYEKKNIPTNEAKIIFVRNNFHGRTLAVISASIDPSSTTNFGPFLPGFTIIPYDDLTALEAALNDNNVAGFIVEPIQGEAGVHIPSDGYLKKAAQLCRKNNVLFIADEIQTGLCRTGKMLACQYEDIQPDILILGKALSGGLYPVSAVLADDEIMLCIQPGEHGSTYGGNPIACALGQRALQILIDEKLGENSYNMGLRFRNNLSSSLGNRSIIRSIRGKGLMNAIELDVSEDSTTAWDICVALSKKGLLAKPTHGNIIRFSPPLTIREHDIDTCTEIIEQVISTY